MAETRKFDQSGSEGIQKLVREALGEATRPVTPGEELASEETVSEQKAEEADDVADASKISDRPIGGGGTSVGSW